MVQVGRQCQCDSRPICERKDSYFNLNALVLPLRAVVPVVVSCYVISAVAVAVAAVTTLSVPVT